jgi:spore coat protein A
MQAFGAIATINPSQDNTLAEELPDNSSGACDRIFAGMTANNVARRALLQFDLSSIPDGSTINSVTLSMRVDQGGQNQTATMTLHRVNTAWGEGSNGCGPKGGGQGEPAVNGAATWLSAKHNANPSWGTPGGDYNGAASGSAVSLTGSRSGEIVVWDSTAPNNAGMLNDVSDWFVNPATNYGWILIGDETSPTTARAFNSRDPETAPITPPALVVDFTPSGDVEACCTTDGNCSLTLVGTNDCNGTTQTGVDTCEPNPCAQPTGACCNLDESCSGNVERSFCEDNGGIFQGSSSSCDQGSVDCGLTPFVEPLPIPPVLQPTGTRADGVLQYTVSVEEATQSVHPELPDTTLWTYNGAWPSSTFVVSQGTPIEVTYVNNLPTGGGNNRGSSLLETDMCSHGPDAYGDSKRIVTHLHGGHVPARVDGQPEYHILPGETDVYEYPNNQEAGTLWYHDHALGITRLNVYSGMAGFYLIADSEDTLGPDNAFGFPSGQYEIGMAIQDRQFNPDGSLFYNARLEDAFTGDKLLVNGKVWPYLNVDQGKYRFRILNGSQSREYSLRMENMSDPGNDPSFVLVGTDLGLISAPIDLGNNIALQGPAERMDVIVDFAGMTEGDEIILRNDDPTLPRLPNVMKFIVTANPGYTGTIASTLRPVSSMLAGSEDVIRYFRLAKEVVPCTNEPGRTVNEWFIESLDGPGGNVSGKHWDDVTEFPKLGQREVWEFKNPTSSYHPMHVHLVRFQILSKTDDTTGLPIPLQPWEENTWKDIVHIPPNSTARIIMDFEDYAGRFPNHCHLLDHEDHEMMRQFQATHDPANCNNNGTCDPGEDCVNCGKDCAKSSGALCGNGLCEGGDGEDCTSCPEDCAGKTKGKNAFCCGSAATGCGVDVDDTSCVDASANLFCRMAPRVSACCGDALCEGVETETSCAVDCDPNAVCQPSEPTEVSCFNGQDDDCDLAVDCSDGDCDGATGAQTSCGVGVCATNGNLTCSGGNEVDNCTPLPATEPGGEVTCDNGLDDDCDGLTDANDPDCNVCVPTEPTEVSCFNGLDDDCDAAVDCSDTNCNGALGAPTSCGVGACSATGNLTCSGGSETDSCTPGTPGNEGPFGGATCSDSIDNDCDGDTDANDADCQQAADCSQWGDRNSCNNDPACRWKKNQCQPR